MTSSTTKPCSEETSRPGQGALSAAPLASLGCLLTCHHDGFLAVGCHRAVVGQTLILAHCAGFNDGNRKSIYRQEQIAFLYGEEDNSSHVLHY